MFEKYFEYGLTVLPVTPKTKYPPFKKWQHYCDRHADEKELSTWEKKYKGFGITLPCGPANGIIAIDIDTMDNQVLFDLCPPSPVIKKGRKGETRFFRYHSDVGSKHFKLADDSGDGIDVLSSKTHTVLPPTIHPETKEPYTWLTKDTFPEFPVSDLPIFTPEDFRKMEAFFKKKKSNQVESQNFTGIKGISKLVSMVFSEPIKNKDSTRKSPHGSEGRLRKLASMFIFSRIKESLAIEALLKADQEYHQPLGYFVETDRVSDQKHGSPEANAKHFYLSIKNTIQLEKETASEEKGDFLKCLGFKDQTYFYTTASNRTITALLSHTSNDLLHLMPLDYWETHYGIIDPETGNIKGVAWLDAVSDLKKKCREKGVFNEERVRGFGVWKDQDKVVVHLGNRLLIDNEEVGLHSISNSKFIYELNETLESPIFDLVGRDEVLNLKKIVQEFRFKTAHQSYLFMGWILAAPFCGLLPWRPHLWLVGSAGAGKSTLLEFVSDAIRNQYMSLSFSGETTEAGIRQRLKLNALPITFDEFEPRGERKAKAVESCLNLFRQASSDKNARITKGSAGHKSVSFVAKFMGAVASINDSISASADKSRFFIIELLKLDDVSRDKWTELSVSLRQFDELFWKRIFFTNLEGIRSGKILEVMGWILNEIQSRGFSARTADQYACPLAFYLYSIQQKETSRETCKKLVDQIQWHEEPTLKSNDDALECLSSLLSTRIQGALSSEKITIAELYQDHKPEWKRTLSQFGMKVTSERGLFISNHGSEFDKLFKDSHWSATARQQLRKIPGVIEIKTRLYGDDSNSFQARGFVVPLEAVKNAAEGTLPGNVIPFKST